MRSYAFICLGCSSNFDVHTAGEEPGALACTFGGLLLVELSPSRSSSLPDQPPVPGSPELVVTSGPGTELRLWLDDDLVDRRAPAGWIQSTTAGEAIRLLRTGRVVELSLDHDLDDERYGRGVDVVDFLVEEQEIHGRPLWPRDGITLHTANPSGRDTMARAIRRYAPRFRDVEQTLTGGGKIRFRFQPKQAAECSE